jgi:GST-like protein
MISLYGLASPNVLKVVLMLDEVGLPYEVRHVDVIEGDQFTPEFRAMNPNGRVPVMVDPDGPGGKPFTMFESGAILMYLADKTGKLWPAEMCARHTVSQWLMFQMGGVGPIFGQFMHFKRAAPPGSDYGLARYTSEAKRLFGVMENRLSQSRYLGGDTYTIADVATWPWARYNEIIGLDMARHPNLGHWLDEIMARPAGQKMVKVQKEMSDRSADSFKNAKPDQLDRFYGRGKFATV